MKLVALISVLALSVVIVHGVAPTNKFKWEDCGRPDRKVTFTDLLIGPQPLKVTRKNEFEVTMKAEFLADLPADAVVDIRIKKIQQLITRTIDIDIPCQKNGIQGSCKLDFCTYMNHEQIKPRAESLLTAAGKEFECPLKAGKYEFEAAKILVNLEKAKISPFFQRLGSGEYQLEFRLTQKSGRPLGCLRVKTKVALNLK